jgi:peptidyl-prolyl cis-trans isomerase D
MNKIAKSWVSSLFLGALALSFGIWGIADVFKGNIGSGGDTVAQVGDIKIPSQAFESEYKRTMSAMSQRGEMTPEMARLMGLPQITLQSLIARATIDATAAKLGINETTAQAEQVVYNDPNFKGAGGAFDRNAFLNALSNAGYGEREYVEAVRRSMVRQQVGLAMGANFKLPLGYMKALYSYVDQIRAADFVVVSPESVGAIAPPSDAVLADYLKKNADRFSTPEYRSVTYAAITPADLKDQVKVAEDQVDQAYEARKSSYSTPEKREIEQITYPDEAAAKAARVKIAAGQTFAAAATERGLKPADITLGTLVAADLPGERGKAAFALKEGGVSEPVKDTFGWMLVHVVKITPGTTRDEASAKAEIRTALAEQMASAKIDDIVNAFQDAVAGGDDIPTAAKKAGMKSGKIASMDSKGLAPDGSATGAPADPEFLDQVFKADVGDQGDPFRSAAGAAFAIKVEGVVPPKPRPLEQVRGELVTAWTAEERATRLKAKADELLAKAKREDSLAGIAAELHTSIQKSPGLKRNTPDQTTFSAQLLTQLFEQPAGGIVMAERPKGDGYVIARVTGIQNPGAPDKAADFTNGYLQASQQVATEFDTLLSSAEQSGQKMTVNQKLLDQLTGEGQ